MAANTTSGNNQSYDPGEGRRIFQGLDPDIVLIQEFNFGDDSPSSIRQFVDSAFGSEFDYYREGGNEQIPNGVISRFPIIQSGEWADSQVSNRDFAWARIDIPGDRDLWAVSVHFLTTSSSNRNAQANSLVAYIQSQVPAGDYLVVGGDFNTDSFSEAALTTLSAEVDTSGRPDDQRGSTGTNASRSKPYDQVLPGPDLNLLEVPVTISGHGFSYSEGLVFDSRVFTPLSAVSPVLSGDSGASGMQHMAVIRDFRVLTTGGQAEPSDYPTEFAGTSTTSSISLSWTDVTSLPVPLGYLVKASLNPVIMPPVDGIVASNDSDLSDGLAQVTVPGGAEAAFFSGLPDDTTYYFKIYPFIDQESPDYKTDASTPSVSVSTLPQIGSVPSPPILGSVFYPYSEGFTLTWNESVGATGYRIDVSTRPDFAGSGGAEILNENFDASNSVPAGWVNNGTADDSVSTHYASADNCRALGPNDTLVTPPVDFPGELRFYVDASNNGNGQTGRVSYAINGGGWITLGEFVVSTAGNTEVFDLTSSPDLSAQAGVRFRFESSFSTWYLDDVVVDGAGSSSLVSGYDDLAVGNVSHCAISGLEPDTDYYFRVRAENANGTSGNSATGSERTRLAGTPYSVWAEDFGIAPADLTTDFDKDTVSDYEEFVFGTDPTFAGSGVEQISVEPSLEPFSLVYRRSIAPGLTWEYLAGDSLPLSETPLSPGIGYREYEVVSIVRFGDYEEVTLRVDTGLDSRFFFSVRATP
ncbi:endonuclease/exonuclease/phosphatase family protein [Haloferula sp.]|uniref:endonuclease/exonuclease/phosphatase family protein n=1 Tax=Haloferula sp. TaxID=2497595 RepID=UPI003C776078